MFGDECEDSIRRGGMTPGSEGRRKSGRNTKGSNISNKRVLVIDGKAEALDVIERRIRKIYPGCVVDNVGSYGDAGERITSWAYELAILDVGAVPYRDLLALVLKHTLPVAALQIFARS